MRMIQSEITISEPLAVYDEPIEEPPLLELKAVVVNNSVAVEDDDQDDKDKETGVGLDSDKEAGSDGDDGSSIGSSIDS